MGFGQVGIEPHRLAEVGEGLSLVALLAQGVAQVVVGQGEVRPEPHRRAELGDRLFRLALGEQGQAEVVGRLGVVGLQAAGRFGSSPRPDPAGPAPGRLPPGWRGRRPRWD